MIVFAAVVVLLLMPLLVLRRRTLWAYFAVDAATWLFAGLLWLRVAHLGPWLCGVALAAVKIATLSIFVACGKEVRWSAGRAMVLAGLVYALAVPAMQRHALDGDEPFYLLVTESMVQDFDLDLRNQYAAHGRGPQFNDPTGPNGEQYSRHEPFLSLLLAPGFAIAGANGALATIVFFAMLLVRSTVRWMEDEGIADANIRAVFPLFAFGPPVLYYATRIWPEVPAAFFFVEALRGVRNQRMKRWMPALFGLVMLKLRFALVAVGLIATMFRRRPRALLLGAAILVIPLALLWLITGSATNVHSWRELLPAPGERYVKGFFGLLADGKGGIPFQASFYLLGLAAIVRWKSTPIGFRTGVLAGSLYILYLLPRPEWFGGWAPPLRYLVFFMPVLALGAAATWERLSRGAKVIAAAMTFGLVVHGLSWPSRLFHDATGETVAGEWLSQVYRSDFSRMFPSFIRPNDARWIGVAVVLVVTLWSAGLLARRPRRERESPALPIAAFALLLAAGFHYGKKPASRVELEDTHVVKEGGELYPPRYTMMRVAYRGGWILQAGQSVSFLAQQGTHTLHAITGLGATIELEGHAYHVDPHPEYQRLRVTIPNEGRVTLRCISGAINLDRLDRMARQ